MALLFIAIVVVMTIVTLLTGQPVHNPFETESAETLREVGTVLAVGAILFAAFFYGLGRALTVIVTSEYIAGRTISMKKVSIQVNSVKGVKYENPQGAPLLRIRSDAASSDIYLLLAGVNRRCVADELHEVVGPAHPLTLWFAENSD